MAQDFDVDRIGGTRALRELVDVVLEAGADALRLYDAGAGARYRHKPDATPVTEADHAVEEKIRAFCERRFPGIAFLGEEAGETGETGETGEADGKLRFIVDPIDGTRAFIRGVPTWSILLGLEEGDEPVMGIAFMPAAEDLFIGVRGHGAEHNGRPLHVSGVDHLDDALVCFGTLAQLSDADLLRRLPALVEHTFDQRGFHDFDGYRQVLLGRADAMIDPLVAPWDVCAPAVLIREAGGRFSAIDGSDTIHGGSGVASNGHVHDALVELLGR